MFDTSLRANHGPGPHVSWSNTVIQFYHTCIFKVLLKVTDLRAIHSWLASAKLHCNSQPSTLAKHRYYSARRTLAIWSQLTPLTLRRIVCMVRAQRGVCLAQIYLIAWQACNLSRNRFKGWPKRSQCGSHDPSPDPQH